MDENTRQLIADIEQEVRYTQSLTGRKRLDPRVMAAMASVPRDQFIAPELRQLAFTNQPVAIGHGQTISQPYIVALMTDLLAIKSTDRVLKIGTGSGYQSAILSQLCAEVYSVERIYILHKRACECFNKLGYHNIHTAVANGYHGWLEHAPYDGIIVTAAASHIPQPLLDQLKPGARLVIPVGLQGLRQELLLIEKNEQGEFESTSIITVAFVPLVH